MIDSEPPKYVVGKSGGLQLSPLWKNWRKQVLSNGFERHNKSKNKKKKNDQKITAESHNPNWRVVAYVPGSTRRIYFCSCRAGMGSSFDGCGAVAVQNSRNSILEVVIEPRFE